MKANFALSLSHDGITLLQRSAAGWATVGDVDPASASLAADLAVLRRTATALSPGGVRCKLLIPNDQIRYLTIATPGMDAAERRSAARAALEGATPYAVDELAFDIHVDGDATHVAAVALDTLDEAESFALSHRFAPLSFAARPQTDHAFRSEPFFGAAKSAPEYLAPGEVVEGDNDALLLTRAQLEADPEPEPEPEPPGDTDLTEGSVEDENAPVEASFVSRRRVPTFRTERAQPPAESFSSATEGTVPGFGEAGADYQAPAPRATTAAPKPPAVVPAPAPVVRRPQNDVERFTIYGAKPGKPASADKGLRNIAIMVAVPVLAGIAAFVSVAPVSGVSGLIGNWSNPEPEVRFTAPVQPQAAVTIVEEALDATAPQAGVELASLGPAALTEEDAAVLDALADAPVENAAPEARDDLLSDYAVTGIWPVAPEVPEPAAQVNLDDLYVTSIDPINPNFDAVALPSLALQARDQGFLALASPAPAGTRFSLDDSGMVIATPGGSMNADGIMVFSGVPPVRPPANMVKAEVPGIDLTERLRLAAFRPKERPGNLIETSERAAFSGLTRSELGQIRPQLRPQSAQETALASASLVPLDGTGTRSLLEQPEGTSFDSATARAIVASLRPDARPKDFDKTVAKALERTPPPPTPTPTTVATPRAVTPSIPSSASAARAATVKNALNLRRVNLIGVYGKPSDRRALVRLENGSYRKVQVGDRIDGGRVSAIGDSELQYQKSGRSVVLRMPSG